MGDKRRLIRVKRRLRVDFETPDRRGTGVTVNLSPRGIHLSSALVFVPGTAIRGRLRLPDDTEVPFEGDVRWARKLRGADALAEQNSMGIEFVQAPGQIYFDFVQLSLAQADKPAAATGWAPVQLAPRAAVSTPRPEHASSPAPIPQGDVRIGKLRVGLDGIATLSAGPGDFVSPTKGKECLVAASRIAKLVEEAVDNAVEGRVPEGTRLVGVQLEVLLEAAVVPLGAPIAAAAKLVAIRADTRSLTFEATVSARQREIARGRLVCSLARF